MKDDELCRLYKEYIEAFGKRANFEEGLKAFIDKYKGKNSGFRQTQIDDAINKGYQRLSEMKQKEDILKEQYDREIAKTENKQAFVTCIHHYLGVMPSEYETTDGVLSSNASDSHLNAKRKTDEQLSGEGIALLAAVSSKVKKGEIPLSVASKLIKDIGDFFGTNIDENYGPKSHK